MRGAVVLDQFVEAIFQGFELSDDRLHCFRLGFDEGELGVGQCIATASFDKTHNAFAVEHHRLPVKATAAVTKRSKSPTASTLPRRRSPPMRRAIEPP